VKDTGEVQHEFADFAARRRLLRIVDVRRCQPQHLDEIRRTESELVFLA
jgi:hypothetical protein